jgi:hypothetical protein
LVVGVHQAGNPGCKLRNILLYGGTGQRCWLRQCYKLEVMDAIFGTYYYKGGMGQRSWLRQCYNLEVLDARLGTYRYTGGTGQRS